jgi:hypothetical protein
MISGDFNGDGRPDRAVLIVDPVQSRRGIMIQIYGTENVFILGAGIDFGNGGDDFFWLERWQLVTSRSIRPGAYEHPPPKLVGDALKLERPGVASGLVYWLNDQFYWYQLAD